MSEKSKAYLVVIDGLADWEPAHALCEIRNSGRFEVVTAGLSAAPITTAGGLRVIPDAAVDAIDADAAAIIILPGGTLWEQDPPTVIAELLPGWYASGAPIAAICAATTMVARAGLTRGRRHTSNGRRYLETFVPGYADGAGYVDELAVRDGNLITASGLGCVEFAREIIGQLAIYDEAEAAEWYAMFKHGVLPARYADA